MSVPPEWSDIDVADLAAWFNLYVLPVGVAAVVAVAYLRGRRAPIDACADRARTVRRLGLCHYALALRALLALVPEWVVYRETGLFGFVATFNTVWALTTCALCVPAGFGLRRLKPWGRWAALVADGLLGVAGALVGGWMIAYGAAVYAWDWPDIVAARILPLFGLFVLLMPGTAEVFGAGRRGEAAPARPSVVSLAALAFLVVLGAIIAVNAADCVVSYVWYSEAG